MPLPCRSAAHRMCLPGWAAERRPRPRAGSGTARQFRLKCDTGTDVEPLVDIREVRLGGVERFSAGSGDFLQALVQYRKRGHLRRARRQTASGRQGQNPHAGLLSREAVPGAPFHAGFSLARLERAVLSGLQPGTCLIADSAAGDAWRYPWRGAIRGARASPSRVLNLRTGRGRVSGINYRLGTCPTGAGRRRSSALPNMTVVKWTTRKSRYA